MKPSYEIVPCGDRAINVVFGNEISPEINDNVHCLSKLMSKTIGIVEMVPTFCSLMIVYDPMVMSYKKLSTLIQKKWSRQKSNKNESIREKATTYLIPVCYGGEYGPDLEDVAQITGLSTEEIIRRHTQPDYKIYMLGFLPGFAYLGGLDSSICCPRLSSPRTIIPAGSVGIGGEQTGIYPLDSPGGWRLIGRTPIRPYDERKTKSILYNAGDYIRFYPITPYQYQFIEESWNRGEYEVATEERNGDTK